MTLAIIAGLAVLVGYAFGSLAVMIAMKQWDERRQAQRMRLYDEWALNERQSRQDMAIIDDDERREQ